MTESAELGAVSVIDVARELLGQEGNHRSTAAERHFPDHGGLFVNIVKNKWRSHGNGVGGDAIELIKHVTGVDFLDAKSWLEDRGYIKTNGTGPSLPGPLDRRPKHVREAEAVAAAAVPITPAPKPNGGAHPEPEAIYEYTSGGVVLARKLRFTAPPPKLKDYRWETPDVITLWRSGLNGTRLVPYRLDELKAGIAAGNLVFLVEGEKCANALADRGLVATTFPNKGISEKLREDHGKHFAGADVIILPDEDATGHKQAEAARAALNGIAKSVKVIALGGLEDGEDVVEWLEAGNTLEDLYEACRSATETKSDLMSSSGLIGVFASEVTIKPIEWIWNGRLARGKLTCIAGDPEAGKSHITINVAAAITTGGFWPCGEGRAPVGNVIILSAEDGKVDTIVPRLMAAGANLTKVRIIEAVRLEKDGVRSFDLAQDIKRLEDEVTSIGDVVAFIIDPISSYLGKTDSHKNANVRGVLEPLGKMAERTGVSVLAITHFNKASANNNNSKAIHRFIDSIAFVAAARTAFVATEDPDCEGRKLLLHAKNNIAPSAKGLSYTTQGATVCSDTNILVDTSKLVWGTAHVDQKADDVVRSDTEKRSAITDAESFLREVLKDGPVEASKVKDEAEEAGVAWRTVERAKSKLGVSSVKAHDDPHGPWRWKLPFPGAQPEGESKTANPKAENSGNT